MAEDKKVLHQNVTVEDKERSTKEITGSIPASRMEELRGEALKKLALNISIDGFRKGKVPHDKIVDHVGETVVMEEAANIALSEAYPAIITEHGIQAIGQPHVTITKLAKGNDLEFKITTAVVPEVELGDYKKIVKEVVENQKKNTPITEVDDKELQETIDQVRKNIAMQQKMAEATKDKQDNEHVETPVVKDEDLPELTDDFVKTLGSFENVEDFKTKLKENIIQEKERKNAESLRQAIAEKLVETAKINVPEIVVSAEQDKMLAQLKDDIQRAGLAFEDYLKKINKTEDVVREEWKESAEKKAKMQLILNKIAIEEDIHADKDQLEREVAQMKQFYPEANEQILTTYVETTLTNQKVFEFLEK